MEEEEQETKKQKKVAEEEPERKTVEEAEEAKGVNVHDESDGGRKAEERCEKGCEQKSGTLRKKTSYYCKTCSGEPSLCPVPCFELYHTRLIYKTAPEPETQGEPSE